MTFLEEIINAIGDRYGVLSREMTKLHEEFIRGFLSEIHHILNLRPAVKGECTLLVMGCEENKEVSLETVRNEINSELKKTGRKLSDIARSVAKKYGLPKNKVYDEALKLKRTTQSSERKSK